MADDDEYEPEHPNEKACNALVDALQKKNRSAAAASLRQIEYLPPALIELLADLFDEAAPPNSLFPWKLKFAGKKGKPPVHILDKEAFQFSIWLAVRQALVIAGGKKDSAFKQVKEDIKKNTGKRISETKIKDAYYAYLGKS